MGARSLTLDLDVWTGFLFRIVVSHYTNIWTGLFCHFSLPVYRALLLVSADAWIVDDDLNCSAFYESVSNFPPLHLIVFAHFDLDGVLQDDVEVLVISYGIAKYHNLVRDSDQNWRSITHRL